MSAIVRGSAVVTDSEKATYVLLIYRSKKDFFLHWGSLPAIQKNLLSLKMSSTTRIICFSLFMINTWLLLKSTTLKMSKKERFRSTSKISKKNFEAERNAHK